MAINIIAAVNVKEDAYNINRFTSNNILPNHAKQPWLQISFSL